MPWSPWITPDVTVSPTTFIGMNTLRSLESSKTGWDDLNTLIDELLVQMRAGVGSTDVIFGSNVYGILDSDLPDQANKSTGWGGYIGQAVYAGGLGLDPATERDWMPPELDDLVLGVDYDVRPDRTAGDEDAYVQYDTGPNALIGWQPLTLQFQPVSGHYWRGTSLTTSDVDYDIGVSYRIAIDPEPAWVEGFVPSGPDDIPWKAWTNGTTVSTPSWVGDNGAAVIDLPPVDVADLVTPDTYRFSIYVQEPTLSPAWVTALDVAPPVLPKLSEGARIGFEGHLANVFIIEGGLQILAGPGYAYQMPRWRYWIPGEPPLRQRQRNDGLALSAVPAWAGRKSRQASNRWRGYL